MASSDPTGRNRLYFALVTYALALICAGANIVAPLWPVYRTEYGMSAFVMTLVFIVYVFGALVALVMFGRSSDVWGRRPILITGAACALLAVTAFALAQGVWWLVAGRFLAGIAVGIASAAANAALNDFAYHADPRHPSTVGSLAQSIGFAAGPLVAGVLADMAPWPTRTVFVVFAVFAAVATVAMIAIRNTGRREGATYRMQGMAVPAGIVAPFARACAVYATGWAGGGVILVLGPSMMVEFLGTPSHSLAGAALLLFFGAGALGQAYFQKRRIFDIMVAGLASVSVGLLLMAWSLATHSLILFFAATVIAGAANGISLLGGLTLVNAIAPAGRRAQTLTAFFLSGYLAVAILFPLLGWAVDRYGLLRALVGFALTFSAAALVTFVDLTRWRLSLRAQMNVQQLGSVDDLAPEHLHRLLSLTDAERVSR